MATARAGSYGDDRLADLDELREQVLTLAIVFLLALDLAAMTAVLARPFLFIDSWAESSAAIVALGVLAAAALWVRRFGAHAASLLLVGGLTGMAAWLLRAYPPQIVGPWLPVVVILAAALLGRRYCVGTAGAVSCVLVAVLRTEPAAMPIEAEISTVALIWVTAALAWLAASPLEWALEWAWQSYAQARDRTVELREHQGQLAAALKSLRDAYYRLDQINHELERARQAANHARELKSQFAANISHELRTPLNLIIGFTDVMMAAPDTYGAEALPTAYRADVEAIHRNARHLATLIDDVLDLSQIEAGRMGLYKEHTSLRDLAAEAARAVGALFDHKGLSLAIDVAGDLPPIFVDRARIRQVFVNLLANAAKFTERGGVTISARRQGGSVVVDVADTGEGIAEEDLPKVFEEFRQVDQSPRRRHGGSGLGLAISKDFVELHGGIMWARSRVGGGTTFSFTLPLAESGDREQLHQAWATWARLRPAADEPDPAVVLLTADPGAAAVFRRHLEGYRVVAASGVAEAAELATREAVAAVIAVNAPGAEVQERMRELRPGLPLITCAMPDRCDVSRRLGVSDYLVKPVARGQVLEALGKLGPSVRRVLVVDDDPDMVRLLTHMIRSAPEGYRVLRAYDGDEALARLRERRPDAVVLDLSMPTIDGYRVLQHLRTDAELASLPVIVVTARGADVGRDGCRIATITREGGLGTGELLRCIKAALDSLAPTPRNVPTRRPAPAGSAA